jgi:predicted transcriptional regulator
MVRDTRLTSVVPYVSDAQLERLKVLSARTRVRRSVYWREAVDDLLRKHAGGGATWPAAERPVSASKTHILLEPAAADALESLAKRLRVTQVVLMAEALHDLLRKYEPADDGRVTCE